MTDGTAAGTSLVKDINPNGDFGPNQITALGNGEGLFSADDGTHGRELWVTDGTAAGTALVKDINSSGSSDPGQFTALGNGEALFSALDGTHYALWVTDGTTAGTSMVYSSSGTWRNEITALGNGKALFSTSNTYGIELFVTDGTTAGTSLVKDINPSGPYSTGNSYPAHITVIGNGKAVFEASNGTYGRELWVTDGTAAGTSLVKDINPVGTVPTLGTLPPLAMARRCSLPTTARMDMSYG